MLHKGGTKSDTETDVRTLVKYVYCTKNLQTMEGSDIALVQK
jgi:hypothetical protein